MSGRHERKAERKGRASRAGWTEAPPLSKAGMFPTAGSRIFSLAWFPTHFPDWEQQAGPARGGENLARTGDEMRWETLSLCCHLPERPIPC